MSIKFAAVFICFLIFQSCGNNSGSGSGENNYDELSVISQEKLSKIISDRDGKILFINVWATWCKPCVEEFPDLVRLYNNYEKNIDFVSLSVDQLSDKESLVIPFLKEQNANFPAYLVDEQKTEEFINQLNKEWSGAVPASFVYNEKGELVKFILGANEYKYFAGVIDSLKS